MEELEEFMVHDKTWGIYGSWQRKKSVQNLLNHFIESNKYPNIAYLIWLNNIDK